VSARFSQRVRMRREPSRVPRRLFLLVSYFHHEGSFANLSSRVILFVLGRRDAVE
jgi:hypothetical protein